MPLVQGSANRQRLDVTAQLSLALYPPTSAERIEAVLTNEFQDLDTLATTANVQWNPWTAATQLVRTHRAHHRVINGCDHYRLPINHSQRTEAQP